MFETIYFLSGLGADSRAFASLDLSFCKPVFLEWQIPRKSETIEEYAFRYKQLITEPEPILVGLSFGGMLAMEIAKHVHFKKIIIISSAKTWREIPFYLRSLRWIPLHRWVKPEIIKRLNTLTYRFLRIHKRKDKVLSMQMVSESDNGLVGWTIDRIINWKNNVVPKQTIHIHGKHDILLPHYFVRADHSIAGGKHMIPMIEPDKISALLKKIIVTDEITP